MNVEQHICFCGNLLTPPPKGNKMTAPLVDLVSIHAAIDISSQGRGNRANWLGFWHLKYHFKLFTHGHWHMTKMATLKYPLFKTLVVQYKHVLTWNKELWPISPLWGWEMSIKIPTLSYSSMGKILVAVYLIPKATYMYM